MANVFAECRRVSPVRERGVFVHFSLTNFLEHLQALWNARNAHCAFGLVSAAMNVHIVMR